MKRTIALILALVLVINLVPCVSASESTSDYIEVTSQEAPLRSGAGKKHSEIAQLQEGDCLIVIDYVINKYGNLWYKVEYGDDVGYLYESHAVLHQHDYEAIADGLNVCKCGAYTIDEDSTIMQTNAAVATAGTLITAEAVAAAGQLSAAGAAIAGGLAAAFPYVAVAAVGGMLIYMAVNATGTQVKDVTRVETLDDVKKLMDDNDGVEAYFAAVFSFGKVPALILASAPMDLDEATSYLRKCVRNPLSALVYDTTGISMLNIYTFTDDLARQLCKNFVSKEKNYAYGNSKKVLGVSEHDHSYDSQKIYFEHYHIFRINNPFSLTKERRIHILFGVPLDQNAII